jgi:serine/threonine protein kinase
MAGVWVARGHPVPGEPEQLVAVKAMLPELASNMEFRSMFLDEGQIVGSIDHPNVVRVYDVGEADGILYMAMEWVEGDSLHTMIAEANKRRPIPSEVAVRLIADTAAGLHAAHELRGWDGALREIVHCDVSPHNILIGLDGKVKLVDFGVAGAMNQINNEAEVKIRGKFGYMSPEQAQAKALDRRSDIFSLGIVLFELTTGYRLFRGRDDRHTLELVTWGKIPKPSQVLPDYPERLEKIVTRALERDPSKRFQTADEFRDALETYLVSERILVPAAGVKGLLRKVLGSKIEQRRQQVRNALRALDGVQSAATLVADDLIAGSPEDEAISVSVADADPVSDSADASVSHASKSPGLGAAFLPGDGSGASGVQTLSQPAGPPSRPQSKYMLIGAGAGVLIAGAAFVVFGGHSAAPQVQEGQPKASGAIAIAPQVAPVRPNEAPPAAGSARKDSAGTRTLDSLPEDDGTGQKAGQPPVVPAQPVPQPRTLKTEDAERIMRDVPSTRPETKSDKAPEPTKVTLPEEPTGDRVKEIAQGVTLDEPSQAPKSDKNEIDRAAASAAMARAAAQVSSCKRPGGSYGPGRALVTVTPSGAVDTVAVQGRLAGTPEGDCVAGLFRGVKVPAFSGTSVTLSRGFIIPE